MPAFDLKKWLRKMPQPVAILADDKRIDVPKGRSWIELSRTIEAMGATKLSCLDGQGAVIRATVLEDSEEESQKSPEMTDLQFFGKLLAEAHTAAGKSYEPLLSNAMMFIERQGQRLAKAESEIERLRNHIHKLNAELAAPEVEAPIDSGIVGALMEGVAAAAAQQQQVTPINKGLKK
jgi:hypothetical protein